MLTTVAVCYLVPSSRDFCNSGVPRRVHDGVSHHDGVRMLFVFKFVSHWHWLARRGLICSAAGAKSAARRLRATPHAGS